MLSRPLLTLKFGWDIQGRESMPPAIAALSYSPFFAATANLKFRPELRHGAQSQPTLDESPPVWDQQSRTRFMVGRVFLGRYEAVRLLGEGGMGKVYLARQIDLQRQVVVKVMHEHLAADPKFRERFQRERSEERRVGKECRSRGGR